MAKLLNGKKIEFFKICRSMLKWDMSMLPKPFSKFFLIFLLLIVGITFSSLIVRAADCDDEEECEEQIEQQQEKYESTSKQLGDIKNKKDSVSSRISQLLSQLSGTESEIAQLEKDIKDMEEELAVINTNLGTKKEDLQTKIMFRNSVLRNYSKKGILNDLEMLFTPRSADAEYSGFQISSFSYALNKSLTSESLRIIDLINDEITSYEADKKEAENLRAELQTSQQKLVSLKATLQNQKASAEGELANLQKQQDSFQTELSKITQAINDLTAKQQQILREKYGDENETVGDYESEWSDLPDPSFSPAYAFYSNGYPHRVGMSQYGAYGRSKAGQDYKTILKAYYNNVEIVKKYDDEDDEIPVVGHGDVSLQDYLYGIYEIPESWGDSGGFEALKAQAVAARTFAMNYVYYTWSNGQLREKSPAPICTTQQCQVYKHNQPKTGKWKQAVDATDGMIIAMDGKPITAWFASTSGGYTRTSQDVWGGARPWTKRLKDAACDNFTNCSYEGPNYGDSPWFNKAWNSGYPAARAWMKEEEVEDIVNAYLMWNEDEGTIDRLSPPSRDDDAWTPEELIDELEDRDVEPVGEINSIKTFDDGQGYTTKVVVKSANYSNLEIEGYDFRNIFNLRSREKLYIYSGLFNVRTED